MWFQSFKPFKTFKSSNRSNGSSRSGSIDIAGNCYFAGFFRFHAKGKAGGFFENK